MRSKTAGPKQTRIDFEGKYRTRRTPLFRVVLHKDASHAGYAIGVLQRVFHFPRPMAEEVVGKAQSAGLALCAIEPLEHAEFHCEQATSAGLTASIQGTFERVMRSTI